MIRRVIVRSSKKLFNNSRNVDSLEFLANSSIYLNKSLLYYQATNIDYKKMLEKSRLKTKLGTYEYRLAKHSYSADHSSSYTKLGSIELARQFVNSLTLEERTFIKEQILETEKEAALNTGQQKVVVRPTWRQLSIVSLQCGLPFIGFGFVDNFLMIIAGDFIESSIGMVMPISTMAAAGLGNAVSDVAGIGIAHHIEAFALKLVKAPALTSEQWELPSVSWIIAISKSVCIFVGCVIGMAPLLFRKDSADSEHKKKNANEDETKVKIEEKK